MHPDPPPPEDAEFGFMDDFGDDEGRDSERDPRAWRMAVLAALTCLAAVAVALVLLRLGGGGSSNKHDVSLPIVTGGPSSEALVSPPVAPSVATSAVPIHPIRRVHTSATPTRTRTTTAARSTPAQPPSTSASARPSTSVRPPPPPSTSAAPQPSVLLAKGAPAVGCHPASHPCYFLQVTLINLPGDHQVVCEAQSPRSVTVRVFGVYDTSQTTRCSYNVPGDLVWVVVDSRYKSNVITW